MTEPARALSETEPGTPLYGDVESWVDGYFAPMFLHRVTGSTRTRWCTRWWDHAEAIARLTLLWNTWEAARWEPAAKPGWWLDLDHHLPILLSADGPFRNCRQPDDHRPAKHEPAQQPPTDAAPDDWWWNA
ncbi:DUF4913 domain-containing protein [Catenuloplanes japonicus]|uniref:DUF4913 domain-containing protein n=1 Tax=Catenuloplanes japonicus TaxID=33876 RepID=UPI00068CC4BF|nr:DUF4913 domain-containing protein [Catenuloplanes japonicus]